MAAYPSPITHDNFCEVWEYVCLKLYWARKKAATRGIVEALSQFFFFFGFLIFFYGVLYEMCGASVRSFLEQIPEFAAVWEAFSRFLFADARTEIGRLLRCAGVLYLPAIGVSVLTALIILCCYHPKTPVLVYDHQENAWQLRLMTQRIFNTFQKERNFFRDVYCVLMVLIWGIFAGVFIHHRYAITVQPDSVSVIWNLDTLIPVGCIVLLFPVYRLLSLPMEGLLQLMYRGKISPQLMVDARAYFELMHSDIPAECYEEFEIFGESEDFEDFDDFEEY